MNCSESLYWLQLRLDGEPVPQLSGLRDHLAACPNCRDLHAAAGKLVEGLRLLPTPVAPPRLNAAIVRAVAADRTARLRRGRFLAVASLAAAACLFVALLLGWPRHPGGSPVVQQPPPNPATTAGRPEVAAGPSVRKGIYDMGSAYVALTYRYADETIGQGKVLLPEALPSPRLTDVGPLPLVAPPSQVLEGAGPGVAAPAEVVAEKFQSAAGSVSFLWRARPPAPDKP